MNLIYHNFTNLHKILIGGYPAEVIDCSKEELSPCPTEMQLAILENIPKDNLALFASVSTYWKKFSDSKYEKNEDFRIYKALEKIKFERFIDIKMPSWGIALTFGIVDILGVAGIINLLHSNSSNTSNTTF